MNAKSILIITRKYYGSGGHDIVINNLCHGLAKLGYKPIVGSFSFEKDPPDGINKIKLK